MKVNRTELLATLEAVTPGLALRGEILEQSSCFVFTEKELVTYDESVACVIATPLPGITGAVKAAPLKAILERYGDDTIDISVEDCGVIVKAAKNRRSKVAMENELADPMEKFIESWELPSTWTDLDDDFDEAVAVVQGAAGKDASSFYLVCVHVHPEYLEATDNFKICRYPLTTGVTESRLVRRDSLVHVVGLGMTEIGEQGDWLCFQNTRGLVVALRTAADEYPTAALTEFLQVKGDKVQLPDGLVEAVDRAEVFSVENVESNQIRVSLKSGKMKLSGTGASGWHEELRDVKYSGPKLDFLIAPSMLRELLERTTTCVVGEGRLKLDGGGKFEFVACLGEVD